MPKFPVSRVRDSFKRRRTADPSCEKRVASFFDELLWFPEAIADRKANDK